MRPRTATASPSSTTARLRPYTPDGLKDRVGGDVISFSTADNEAAAGVLRDQYRLQPSLQDGTVRFHVASGETFLPEFVRSFPQRLLSVGLRRPTLDDVFLDLTGREIRDSELDAKDMMLQQMGRRWGR